jgi:hypothetical protein
MNCNVSNLNTRNYCRLCGHIFDGSLAEKREKVQVIKTAKGIGMNFKSTFTSRAIRAQKLLSDIKISPPNDEFVKGFETCLEIMKGNL